MFKFLFGTTKSKPELSVMETVQTIKETVIFIGKKIDFNEMRAKKCRQDGIHFHKEGRKHEAIAQLKQCKRFEESNINLYKYRDILEIQGITLENSTLNTKIVNCMEIVSSTMKANNLDVGNVIDTITQIQETIDDANEINHIISQPIGDVVYDEDELLNELNEWDYEQNSENLIQVDDFPDIPNNCLVKNKDKHLNLSGFV